MAFETVKFDILLLGDLERHFSKKVLELAVQVVKNFDDKVTITASINSLSNFSWGDCIKQVVSFNMMMIQEPATLLYLSEKRFSI